jgi:hypothetical protein
MTDLKAKETAQERPEIVGKANVKQSLEQLLDKKRDELIAKMEDNRSFAMQLWAEDKVKVDLIPQEITKRNYYYNSAASALEMVRLLVKHDNRYTIDIDMEGQDENGDYADHKTVGQAILDSAQAQKYVEEKCTNVKRSKKDIEGLEIPWEFHVRDQWNNYLEGLEQYKVRQEEIAKLKITSNSLREQLRKIEKEIDELDSE